MSSSEHGDKESKIVLLGEAPSHMEERLGEPFVGPAGKVLNECLHGAGLIRQQCYLLNVFPCQLKKTRDKKTFMDPEGEVLWSEKGAFTPAGAKHVQNLMQKLEASGANIIVPLGRTAMEALGLPNQVMRWRGSLLWHEGLGRKAIGTIHPSAVLQGQFIYRYIIIHDLRRAADHSKNRVLRLPERELLLDPSFAEATDFLRYCREKPRVATDIEVFNKQVSCFSLAVDKKTAMSIPLIGKTASPRWNLEEEMEIWRLYAQLLADAKVEKINQNIIFDLSFLLQQNGIIYKGPTQCTMCAQHIIYPDFPKGLDFICSVHTEEPYYKDEGKLWSKPWADPLLFWGYNAKDSVVAFEAWEALEKELEEGGFRPTYDMTTDMFPTLIYMMNRGMHVDIERLEEARIRASAKEKALLAELEEVADYPFSPASPKQCQQYFYDHKGIKPYIQRKTGRPTTDDTAMSRIVRRFGLKEAHLVQQIRAVQKLIGTYLEIVLDADGRIRCSINPRGTWTGRLSTGKTVFGTGMNLQNLHPEFKGFVGADPLEENIDDHRT